MRRYIPFLLAMVVIHVIGAEASAESISVPNQGFEDPATTTLVLTSSWVKVNNSASVNAYNPYQFNGGNAYYVGANRTTDPANGGSGYPGIGGENLAFVYQQAAGAGMSQMLSATLAANTTYTLTVAEGARNGSFGGPFSGSTIELLAGTTVIASSTDNVGPTPGTFVDQTATLANSSLYSSLVGQPLTIELLTSLPFTRANQATDWDNVRLDAVSAAPAVPEPSSLSLLLAGAGSSAVLALAWVSRRRKQPSVD